MRFLLIILLAFGLVAKAAFSPLKTTNGGVSVADTKKITFNGFPMIDQNNGRIMISGGGSATPGGNDTEIQFNKAGAFDGNGHLLYDYNSGDLSFNGPGQVSFNPDSNIDLDSESGNISLNTDVGSIGITSADKVSINTASGTDIETGHFSVDDNFYASDEGSQGTYVVVGPYSATLGGDAAAQFNITNNQNTGIALFRFGASGGASGATGEFGAGGTDSGTWDDLVFYNTKGSYPQAWQVDGVEAMRVATSRNIGIADFTPDFLLDVNGTAGVKALNLNGNTASIGPANQGALLFSNVSNSFSLLNNGANHTVLKTNGNVLRWETDIAGSGANGSLNISKLTAVPAFTNGDLIRSVNGTLAVLPRGTNHYALKTNGNTVAWEALAAGGSGSGGGGVDVQAFTANGTWIKPANAAYVEIFLIGGGGGGGSGRKGDVGSLRRGGGGGGSAQGKSRTFLASEVNGSYLITIGKGGNGGIGITVNDSNGNIGSNGETTSIGGLISALGGNKGFGGGNSASGNINGSGGVGISGSGFIQGIRAAIASGSGAASSTTGGSGQISGAISGSNLFVASSAGASGGGITTGDSASTGGNSGALNGIFDSSLVTAGATGGAISSSGAGGIAIFTSGICASTGGGGGGSSISTNAGAGGKGGNCGSGGGAGGASLNSVGNSGAGGKGGNGYVAIITYISALTGNGTPGGQNSYIQYNKNGTFGGNGAFAFDATNRRVGVGYLSPTDTLSINGSLAIAKTITALTSNGDVTINNTIGTANFKPGSFTLKVTNSLVTANSVILITQGSKDANIGSITATALSGAFNLDTLSAPLTTTRINWMVIN